MNLEPNPPIPVKGYTIAKGIEDHTFRRKLVVRYMYRWKFILFDQQPEVAQRIMNIPCRYICGGYKGTTIHHFANQNQFTGYVLFVHDHTEETVAQMFNHYCKCNPYLENPVGFTRELIRVLYEDTQRFYARGYLYRKEMYALVEDKPSMSVSPKVEESEESEED